MEISDGLQNSSPPVQQTSNMKSWEHAWSIDEIRKNAQQWSLAADVGLLEHMKEFASRITAQAHDVSKEVSQLLHDTRLTDARIQTVTDYFLTLSDSQFIENRVYDEDDTVQEKKDEKYEEKNKTREEREAEMLPRLKEAVKFGLTVIEDAYDILDVAVGDSDSEDDDDLPSNEVILEPKDPYVTRPLPHLIGSRGFHEEDDVGVGDLLSGDEAESEVGSMSESDEEIEKAPFVSDVSTSDYDTDGDSDVEEDSDHQAPIARKKTTTVSSSDDYSSSEDGELFANKAKADISDSESSVEEKQTAKKRAASKQSQPEQGMFDGDDDDDNDLFSASGGLFGKTGGLFDAPKSGLFDGVEGFSDSEDDEEKAVEAKESPSTPAAEKPTKQSGKKLPPGGVSLFGGAIKKGFFQGGGASDDNEDDDDDEEDSSPKQPVQKTESDLFDDDSDDGGLFSNEPPPTDQMDTSVKVAASKTAGGLFDESSEEDLFNEPPPVEAASTKQPTDSGKKRPVGGVSMFGGEGGALQDALRKRRSSSLSSSDDAQNSNSFFTNSATAKSKQSFSNKKPSLFDDDDDSGDDLFAGMSKTSVSTNKPGLTENSAKSTPGLNGTLFASSTGDDLFAPVKTDPLRKSNSTTASHKNKEHNLSKKPQKQTKIGEKIVDPLLGNSSEPLFSPVSKSFPNDSVTKEEVDGKVRSSGSKSNLFRTSDSENELFSSSPIRHQPSIQEDDSDNFFSNKPSSVASKAKPSPSVKPTSKSSDLFGDSDDDNHKPAFVSKKIAPTKKQSTLFDDDDSDDDLFSGMNKANPVSATTNQPSKAVSAPTSLKATKKSTAESITSSKPKSKDLFDSDSDDDLFAPKSVPAKVIPQSHKPAESVAPPTDEIDEEVKEEMPKKKPAGAVSMFGAGGGGELLAAISKRRSPSQKSNVSDASVKSSPTLKPKKNLFDDNDDDALFGDLNKPPPASTNVTAKPFDVSASVSPPAVTKVSAPKLRNNVGKLQVNLAINPASLLPGAAPKIVSTVDVDAPLQSVTKTRSKGQAGRRPPTRRGRQKVVADAGGETPVPSSTNVISAADFSTSTSDALTTDIKPSLDNNDFMDELLSSSRSSVEKISTKKESATSKKKTKLPDLFDEDDDGGDNLFQSSKSSKKKNDLLSDDLFGTSGKSGKTAKPDVGSDLFSVDLGLEVEDSLFNEKPSKAKPKKTKLFDDDLFADIDAVKTTTNKKKPPASVENGDTDIFSIDTKKTTGKKPPKTEISSLDADDLFGDSSPAPSKKSSKLKATNKAKSLFDDDTDDLFGDIPSSKPKEKKKAAFVDPLFDDDDIFSSVPPKTTTKSSKKSKTSTAAKKTNEPDIFDDPLNALLGS